MGLPIVRIFYWFASNHEIGMMMTAAGELKGEVFEATSARILPAMQMMKR